MPWLIGMGVIAMLAFIAKVAAPVVPIQGKNQETMAMLDKTFPGVPKYWDGQKRVWTVTTSPRRYFSDDGQELFL